MKNINLLPKEVKTKDVKSILLNAILVILIIIFVVMGIFSVILFNVNNYLTPQLDNYIRANMQLNNYITKLEAYNQFKVEVKETKELTDYLLEEEVLWSNVLYNFSQNMPNNTYIAYIEGDSEKYYDLIYETQKPKPEDVGKVLFFTIVGYALDYTDVTKLVVHIGNMENVGEVLISNIGKNYVTDLNIEVLSYNINAYMDMGPFLEELSKKSQTEQVEDQDVLEEELEMLNQ